MAIHRAVPVSSKNLGETLLEAGVITPEMLALAEARAGDARERIGDALVELGAASEDDVLRALAAQRGLAFLSAEELPFSPPVLKNLSPKYLRQYAACPITLEGSTLTVATADPTNPLLVDELRQTLALNIALCVAPRQAILEAIERTYGASTALQKIVEGMGPTDGDGDREEDITQLRDMAFEAPVVRLVNLLIEEAVASEASDIHIEPSEDTLRVRYRIDGILYDLEAPPRRLQAAVTSRIKLMAELNIAERRLPQDGRIRMTLNTRRIDIRVSSVPTIYGESIVMRLLDRSSVFMPFDKLGFSPAIGSVFDRLINQPNRIVLVTGPTGFGEDDHPLRRARQDQCGGEEDHHDRRPRRIPAQRRQPDRRPAEDRTDVRQRTALHRPAGSGRHHGRRDPRSRDGGDLHPCGPDGPPGVLHAPHQ